MRKLSLPVQTRSIMTATTISGLEIRGPIPPHYAEILTPEACAFLAGLFRAFEPRRQELLAARVARQAELDAGVLPDFLPSTRSIREGSWTVAPAPADLLDRRTEITGPVDRKMVINALNSGAKVFMADFEDATSPTWDNLLEGHINLRDAVRRTISFTSPEGKAYKLNEKTATLIVRPRGWHLPEKHVLLDGKPVSGSLFDFGLYFFHNAASSSRAARGRISTCRRWRATSRPGSGTTCSSMPRRRSGSRRAPFAPPSLIETILGAFEAEEILYELREHASGLNCGRWDYIFSCIKKLASARGLHLPRPDPGHDDGALHAGLLPLGHQGVPPPRRARHGGMAAQIPIKNNPAANDEALAKVLADKEREATDGHDGTWVAHPGLVPIALQAFDKHMPGPNQVARQRDDVHVTAADLLAAPAGTITEAGIRTNLSVGIQYLEAWFGGLGCVPLYNLMEDAATAEISRAQLWQWLHCGAKTR
jgi:malate synthase